MLTLANESKKKLLTATEADGNVISFHCCLTQIKAMSDIIGLPEASGKCHKFSLLACYYLIPSWKRTAKLTVLSLLRKHANICHLALNRAFSWADENVTSFIVIILSWIWLSHQDVCIKSLMLLKKTTSQQMWRYFQQTNSEDHIRFKSLVFYCVSSSTTVSETILNLMLQPKYTFYNLLLIVLVILTVNSIFSERPSSLVVSDTNTHIWWEHFILFDWLHELFKVTILQSAASTSILEDFWGYSWFLEDSDDTSNICVVYW